jgi:hypothetical protein
MIKKVIFTAALLVPSLAYAGNPSANLTVQVVPASNGIACDIGPNYTGSIPPGAQAAGFTHCAANYDFTDPFYTTLSNWLTCGGVFSPQWYVSEDGLPPASCPPDMTTQFQMVTDSASGKQALQMTYSHITDWNAGIYDTKMSTVSPFGNPNPPGALFPNSNYTESVVRMVSNSTAQCPASQASGGCLVSDSWSYSPNGVTAGAEWDFIEIYTNGASGGSGGRLPFGSGPSGLAQVGRITGFDPTIYHNYGVRQTIDTNGFAGLCHYLDGSQITNDSTGAPPCTSGGPQPTDNWSARNEMIQEVGPQGSGAGQPRLDEVYMVQRMTVWTCKDWNSSDPARRCNTAVLTSAP